MRMNHILVLSDDMTAMRDFFVDAIGLEDGPRPPFPFPGHWLYSEGEPLIHLAARGEDGRRAAYLGMARGTGSGAVDHVAFSGLDLADTQSRLDRAGSRYTVRRVPADGHTQLFVEGPEGLKIELLFPLTAATPTH